MATLKAKATPHQVVDDRISYIGLIPVFMDISNSILDRFSASTLL